MTYKSALDYIHSLGRFKEDGIPGQNRMRRLCELLDNPQDKLKFIHIAGTNGKGSVTAMLSSVLTSAGYVTGRFISPFIYRFNERISIDGMDISDEDIAQLCKQVKCTAEQMECEEYGKPVEFEFITAMAFLYFLENGCDIAVLETGLGGRLDATNVIKSPEVCVITVIDYDHMAQLGDTIRKIAAEKCGIIKPRVPVVSYSLQKAEAECVIRESTAYSGSPLIIPDVEELRDMSGSLDGEVFRYRGEDYTTSLAGEHQIYNAMCVIEAAGILKSNGYNISQIALYHGIAGARFPARFEILSRSPLIIFDGAHNISGIESLTYALKTLLTGKKLHFICGMLTDKNPEQAVEYIVKHTNPATFFAVSVNNPRSASPSLLADTASKWCLDSKAYKDVRQALAALWDMGEDNTIVCFGSLYLASQIKEAVKKLSWIQ